MANFYIYQEYRTVVWLVVLLPLFTAAVLDNPNFTNVNSSYPVVDNFYNHAKKLKYVNKTSSKLDDLGSKNSSDVLQTQNLTSETELKKNLSNAHKVAISQKSGIKSPFYKRIHSTLTQSKDAVWATLALTFMCIILFLAVAQSKMWKNYHGSEAQGIPLPNFNERVPFKEVMERKMATLKELLSKGKRKTTKPNETELEFLLEDSE